MQSLNLWRKGNNPTLTIGEMYCGPGGLGIASNESVVRQNGKSFGYRHVWATDYDFDTCLTYAENVIRKSDKNAQVVCSDIRSIDPVTIPPVDGLLFGFPCNDFSSVGESKGLKGKFGPLYQYGVNFISMHNPIFFLAENVSGISSANSGNAFEKILSSLEEAGRWGYDLTTHLYKFEDYGVPQARHRYIIVGIRKDLKLEFRVPAPTFVQVSARQAIEVPPIHETSPNHDYVRQSPTVVERLKFIKPGQNAWTAEIPPELQLNVKGAKLSQIYKRLVPDKPSYTITGSGGGGTHVYHWKENRALTNRERARLQTFPDDFLFMGNRESVRKQIGMAVPPSGGKFILESILKTLLGIEYESVEASFR
jgi:DNA (cytosine-5)-methyltransferase 1